MCRRFRTWSGPAARLVSSRLAFGVWLLASVLVTAHAIAIRAAVFIVLGGIQIVATALIVAYAARYKDTPCPIHLSGPAAAGTAAQAGTRPALGVLPPAWPEACERALRERCRSRLRRCTRFPAAYLKRTT